MTFVQAERDAMCDQLLASGPDQPTLCDGWNTHDLAAHLWVRENDPIGAAGIVIPPLAGVLQRHMSRSKQRWSYPELVQRLRQGPPRFSPTRIPQVDEAGNLAEFITHHEDVRRGGENPLPPRELDPALEDWIWQRLGFLSKMSYRKSTVGVVLDRADRRDGERGDPQTIRASRGSRIVTVIGKPTELLLYGFGRTGAADVTIVGEPDAVAELEPGSF